MLKISLYHIPVACRRFSTLLVGHRATAMLLSRKAETHPHSTKL